MKNLVLILFLSIAGTACGQGRYTRSTPLDLIGAHDLVISGKQSKGVTAIVSG